MKHLKRFAVVPTSTCVFSRPFANIHTAAFFPIMEYQPTRGRRGREKKEKKDCADQDVTLTLTCTSSIGISSA